MKRGQSTKEIKHYLIIICGCVTSTYPHNSVVRCWTLFESTSALPNKKIRRIRVHQWFINDEPFSLYIHLILGSPYIIIPPHRIAPQLCVFLSWSMQEVHILSRFSMHGFLSVCMVYIFVHEYAASPPQQESVGQCIIYKLFVFPCLENVMLKYHSKGGCIHLSCSYTLMNICHQYTH